VVQRASSFDQGLHETLAGKHVSQIERVLHETLVVQRARYTEWSLRLLMLREDSHTPLAPKTPWNCSCPLQIPRGAALRKLQTVAAVLAQTTATYTEDAVVSISLIHPMELQLSAAHAAGSGLPLVPTRQGVEVEVVVPGVRHDILHPLGQGHALVELLD